ncbi:acetyl-CoA synthetase-like protein [Gonapodya prolifera JEL478]|uniref:Acetyl-CoA synthetase-like protein n=1 Tax=Gonapodya prolifera (strain JEL478) TaxID=1344416 RepID=A0A139AGB8_GONPJ|nr:acetyl-CoA synthetase-like protein [Gonapodya prolifera JEL478]|eukprot:KXS15798.1 acetyl-CoA synthetase-like protein [Gonapodya prolifera JEL478]
MATRAVLAAGALAAVPLGLAVANARWNVLGDRATIESRRKTLEYLVKRDTDGRASVVETFIDTAAKKPEAEALVYATTGRSFCWRELNELSNALANYLLSTFQVRREEYVAILFENSPEMIITMIALWKIGARIVLVNYNFKTRSLVQAITTAHSRLFIFESARHSDVRNIVSELRSKDIQHVVAFCGYEYRQEDETTTSSTIVSDSTSSARNSSNPSPSDPPPRQRSSSLSPYSTHSAKDVSFTDYFITETMLKSLDKTDSAEARARRKKVRMRDGASLIFTSGTTGAPKASINSHVKYSRIAPTSVFLGWYRDTDRWYSPLPLYHSASGIGLFVSWFRGTTLIITRRFSARNYFREAAENNATVVQYIGEIARFVLATPPTPYDRNHRIRACFGNGLRPEIWEDFKVRFRIPVVMEFYGSTEGCIFMMNIQKGNSGIGACGIQGPLLRHVGDVKLVKYDIVHEVPIRGKDGFFIEVGANETGEVLGRLRPEAENPTHWSFFEGYYNDAELTKAKVLYDCFEKGDSYFRMGDLMRRDEYGYFYFIDRVGDLIRFRTENISTLEVASSIQEFYYVKEAAVYGIKVKGVDGSVPMAIVTLRSTFDNDQAMDLLGRFLYDRLPSYAIPRFIRIAERMDLTSTQKIRVVDWRKDGADPDVVKGPLYWLDLEYAGTYVPLMNKDYERIADGRARL